MKNECDFCVFPNPTIAVTAIGIPIYQPLICELYTKNSTNSAASFIYTVNNPIKGAISTGDKPPFFKKQNHPVTHPQNQFARFPFLKAGRFTRIVLRFSGRTCRCSDAGVGTSTSAVSVYRPRGMFRIRTIATEGCSLKEETSRNIFFSIFFSKRNARDIYKKLARKKFMCTFKGASHPRRTTPICAHQTSDPFQSKTKSGMRGKSGKLFAFGFMDI